MHPASLSSVIESRWDLNDWKEIASSKYRTGFTGSYAYITKSYDLADLGGEVPAEAYFMAPNPNLSDMRNKGNSFKPDLMTIFDDYRPFISVSS